MHAKLKVAVSVAAIITAVPAASIASAHEGRGGSGRDDAGHAERGQGKPGKRCDRGRGYEAQGRLADGSSLTQVAGADTDRRGDDRFSGTLVVQVKQGNRRGRAEIGLTSYAVEQVRALGTATGDDPLPPVGTRVLLVGSIAKAACPTVSPKPSPSAEPSPTGTSPAPTPTPSATPTTGPTATAARLSHGDDAAESADDTGRRPARGGDDDAGPRGTGGDDASPDDRGSEDHPRRTGDDDTGDDSSSDDTNTDGGDAATSTTPEATASAAVIDLVVFKGGRRGQR